MRLAQRGDRDALNQLLSRYAVPLHRIVEKRLGPSLGRAIDAADVVQRALLIASRNLARFVPCGSASLLRWLVKLAENQITDAARFQRAQRRDRRRTVSLHTTPGPGRTREADPGDVAARSELVRLVHARVPALRAEYRNLIVLRDFLGLRWDTIALVLGRPTGAAARMMYVKAIESLSVSLRAPHDPPATHHVARRRDRSSSEIPAWVHWLDGPVWISGRDGHVMFANRSAERLLGCSEAEMRKLPCYLSVRGRLLDGTPFCRPECAARCAAERCEELAPAEIRVGSADRSIVLLYVPLRARARRDVWLVGCGWPARAG